MLSVFSNCFASHSNLDAVRGGLEVIVRGIIENITADGLEELGWEKQTAQTSSFGPYSQPVDTERAQSFSELYKKPNAVGTYTAHDSLNSYNLAVKSLSPFPRLDESTNPSLREKAAGSLECEGKSLHERYWNTWKWVKWLHENGVDVSRPKVGIWRYNVFWVDWEAQIHPWVCLYPSPKNQNIRTILSFASIPVSLET